MLRFRHCARRGRVLVELRRFWTLRNDIIERKGWVSMHLVTQPVMSFPRFDGADEIATLIREHLWGDWFLSVEHADYVAPLRTPWQRWGESFYDLRDPEDVINAVAACHACNPSHVIRLYAEKFRPASTAVYWVRRIEAAGGVQSEFLSTNKRRRAVMGRDVDSGMLA